MKTIINAIQARHKRASVKPVYDDLTYPEARLAHADRQALLDIIREIENIAEYPPIDREILSIINRTEP